MTRGRTHWHDFVHECRRLDRTYNGVVFKHHPVLDMSSFEPKGGVFADICDEITDEHSPYNFDSIPIEILGRIYERFLGKVVLTKRNRVEVVEKPDVRKAGGVYYTPDYIVAYMVEQALEPKLRRKTPDQVLQLQIIDTACGSGSFLIGAYGYLMHAVLHYWRRHEKGARRGMLEDRNGQMHLTLKYRREILVNCIYGVDIDSQAVEVAQLSLYLKLLEDETTSSARQQQVEIGAALLPSLTSNIVVGNSLVSPTGENADLFSVHEQADRKALNFRATFPRAFKGGGFDLIIGNPPYIKEYTNREAFDYVRSSPYYEGKMDIWYMFACIGLDLLKPGSGTLAYIATNNWVTNAGAKKLRAKLASEATIEQLIDFGNFKVFKDAGIQTMILIARRDAGAERYEFDLRRLSGAKPTMAAAQGLLLKQEQLGCEYLTATFDRATLRQRPFTFSCGSTESILDKIARKRNFELDGARDIAQGIVPNPDVLSKKALELIPTDKRKKGSIAAGQGVFVVDNAFFGNTTATERQFLKPLYEPTDVERYALVRGNSKQIIYSTKANTTVAGLPQKFRQHLERFREVMEERRENQNGRLEYFHLHWPRDERFFSSGPKILAVRKCESPTFAYTEDEAYVMMSFNVLKTNRVDLLFLTGLLNSSVIKFWLKHRGKLQGQNFQIDKEPLLAIPIHAPSQAEQARIGRLVRQISELKRRMHGPNATEAQRISMQRLVDQLDDQIQTDIQQLYDLTPSEVAILNS